MRNSFNYNLLLSSDSIPFGINLGRDYCAEHEWGIKGIRTSMGKSPNEDHSEIGLCRYSCSKGAEVDGRWVSGEVSPPKTRFLVFGDEAGFINARLSLRGKSGLKKSDLSGMVIDPKFSPDGISCAWDSRSFAIAVNRNKSDNESWDFVIKLSEAIKNKDFSVWFFNPTPDNPFSRPGLVISITSLVPKDTSDYMEKCHKSELDNASNS